MEWLLAHSEEFGSSSGNVVGGGSSTASSVPAAEPEPAPSTALDPPESESQAEAKSLKCDECGKLCKNQVHTYIKVPGRYLYWKAKIST